MQPANLVLHPIGSGAMKGKAHRMNKKKHRKKQPVTAARQLRAAQRIPTLGATIAALMVTPLTALGQSQEDLQTLKEVQVLFYLNIDFLQKQSGNMQLLL